MKQKKIWFENVNTLPNGSAGTTGDVMRCILLVCCESMLRYLYFDFTKFAMYNLIPMGKRIPEFALLRRRSLGVDTRLTAKGHVMTARQLTTPMATNRRFPATTGPSDQQTNGCYEGKQFTSHLFTLIPERVVDK